MPRTVRVRDGVRVHRGMVDRVGKAVRLVWGPQARKVQASTIGEAIDLAYRLFGARVTVVPVRPKEPAGSSPLRA